MVITLNKSDRKQRYVVQSVLAFIFIYLLFLRLDLPLLINAVLCFVFAVLASFISHYPNIKINNLFFGAILPFQLLLGVMLFLNFFPNLSLVFKLFFVFGTSLLYYAISLVDNIFLVVEDREEQIPLYRAAITWGQILTIIVAIPLFSALFKFNINAFWQALMVALSAFLFSLYQFWGLRFDKDAKTPKVGEFLWLNVLVGFLVFAASISVSFFPTEAFLRALYVSAVLMFGSAYVYSHLKNDINEKMLVQFVAIVSIFFLILLVFVP